MNEMEMDRESRSDRQPLSGRMVESVIETEHRRSTQDANFITKVLPGCGLQPIVDVLDNLGVTTVEDLNFVEVDDLGGILKKVECKKLLARARRPSTDTQSSGTERHDGRLDDSCLGSPASSLVPTPVPTQVPSLVTSLVSSRVPSQVPFQVPSQVPSRVPSKSPLESPLKSPLESLLEFPQVPSLVSSRVPSLVSSRVPSQVTSQVTLELHDGTEMASTSECSISGGKGTAALDNNCHYSFNIPWNLMPSHIKKTLEKKERPTARDRREIIRLISAEIVSSAKSSKEALE
ncbi:hypothetical protein F7725_015890 [Dissostichus mawsoni]|uniref:Uncharacterized protein n=1 Tax=Dissostichus mawsoni TaxID=36200 RepID=A0A7J5YJQ8_DISMA|nr:hypothetical protein F7725_015890 [Dissostichus mawsoni]